MLIYRAKKILSVPVRSVSVVFDAPSIRRQLCSRRYTADVKSAYVYTRRRNCAGSSCSLRVIERAE